MRKIISLSLGFSFLIMSYTGIMLYIVPQGKVAYWVDWHLLGLSKTQYGELHATSMFTMLFFSAIHIYYNWKPLIGYLKDKSKKISFTKKEFLIAFGINSFFVISTLYMVQPVKSILDLQSSIKEYWADEYGVPPYGHAEESRLSTLSRKQNINLEQAKENLKASGIKFDEDESILDIAKKNNTIPSKIYKIMHPQSQKVKKSKGMPSNLGRKTLQELHDMNLINVEEAITKLQTKNIDVSAETKMKQISQEMESTPRDVYNFLNNK
ncbi:MAG: hypothetical protein ACI9TV_002377 [Sulfurimonas sp.]|jgi:hypothetical protein|uniref:DUF4405 domain-containing protein n=1 Tax=Sulfurimonas sp. TaxID=2022749 RepID=UPI0039E34A06